MPTKPEKYALKPGEIPEWYDGPRWAPGIKVALHLLGARPTYWKERAVNWSGARKGNGRVDMHIAVLWLHDHFNELAADYDRRFGHLHR